jgi:TolA-binding protein
MAMTEERKNEILRKAYKLIETPLVPHVSPPESQMWQPRHVEPEPAPAPQGKSMTEYEAARLRNELDAHVARYERDRTGIASCLEAIADEAGAAIDKLEKQLGELKSRVDELSGELALQRALAAPKRSSKARGVRAANGLDAHVN